MKDYSKTRIYYIRVGDEYYYGHTIAPLWQRKSVHKADFARHPERKLYKAMREAGMSADDIELIWVEDYPCDNVEQARARERYYMEQFGTLNHQTPGRTDQEYRVANRERRLEQKAAYYMANRERIAEYHAAWYSAHRAHILQKIPCPDCGKEITQGCMARHRKLHAL